ncbi:hypothetical protein SAMN06297280_0830 [Arsukibacterium tuosuense]|uniref:Uncharacterized protein n=1 Tax=Arsukibacterium tuosuense TaxID=1323745 RepID=A0A285IAS4_9GAMM|nr:hypothetical protein [Arsukibacterium tuosuense]SNY45075.1 hypothetical protein SAMN06297280_0830 [Arsukibacterium tuosuense]
MNEQQLELALQQLERNIQPERDLWPDITARLDTLDKPATAASAAANRPGLLSLASAAALVLVALVAWQLVVLPLPAQRSAAMPSAELMLLQVFEQQKSRQLAQVTAIAEGFDNWQQQLSVWDQAIAQVRRALQLYPDEPQLLAQLQQLYQQQLAYIERATLQQPQINS